MELILDLCVDTHTPPTVTDCLLGKTDFTDWHHNLKGLIDAFLGRQIIIYLLTINPPLSFQKVGD